MRRSAFELYHPHVCLAFMAAAIIATFVCINPYLIVVSLACALAYSCIVRGTRPTLRGVAWQLPLIVVIALINPFFSAQGSTLISNSIPGHPIFLESLLYGAFMGGLLVAALLWFACASAVLSSDKVMALASGRFPTITLMISMTLRLIPEIVRRGRLVADTAQACTAAHPAGSNTRSAALRSSMRHATVLMGWSMEDSLETATAMKARGWGSPRRRSSYRRQGVRPRDVMLIAAAIALLVAVVAGYLSSGVCSYYPTLELPCPWWLILLQLATCAAPLLLECFDRLEWRLAS